MRETEPILGRASPRNPRVVIAANWLSSINFEVAWRSRQSNIPLCRDCKSLGTEYLNRIEAV